MTFGRRTRRTFAYDLRCIAIARILMTNSRFSPRIAHRPLATTLLFAAIPHSPPGLLNPEFTSW